MGSLNDPMLITVFDTKSTLGSPGAPNEVGSQTPT